MDVMRSFEASDNTIPILFAGDTSILVKGYNLKDFQSKMLNTLIV
jgi:hypothetical protein